MDLDMRHPAGEFRLADFVTALIAFDRRECGENSTFSYVVTATATGARVAAGEPRPRRVRLSRLLGAIAGGAWLFLPFCVFADDHVRCADGARAARRPPSDRTGRLGRARVGDCAGVLVGREGDTLVVRPAFNEWRAGDSSIVVADDLSGLAAPLRRFVASYAGE
jgi:hypothetical protein